MNQEAYDFLIGFSQCTSLPLSVISEGRLQWHTPENSTLQKRIMKILPDLPQQTSYFIDQDLLMYGCVEVKQQLVLIGPVCTSPLTPMDAFFFLKEYRRKEERMKAAQELCSQPVVASDRLFHIIQHIHFCFYRTRLDLNLLFPSSEAETRIIIEQAEKQTAQQQSHTSYAFEQQYLSLIREGNRKALQEMFENAPSISAGTVATSALRQTKNIFISAATTATRAAIAGGMPEVNAYSMSDVYILEMEQMNRAEDIYQLQYRMIMDFAENVSRYKTTGIEHGTVLKAIHYISNHLHEPLNAESTAKALRISRPWLSRIFSSETGTHISTYIREAKLKEAERLLVYTDQSLYTISDSLCFSTQSAFQNAFRKYTGMTPGRYRVLRKTESGMP